MLGTLSCSNVGVKFVCIMEAVTSPILPYYRRLYYKPCLRLKLYSILRTVMVIKKIYLKAARKPQTAVAFGKLLPFKL